MNIPIQTNQNPIECSTIAERDSVINDPRYRVAGLSVAVNGVLYWLNSDLQTWSPQKDTITGTVELYPNCKYVVKNPATWNPASFTAADLDGCSSVSIGDRILCPSGSSAGIWIAISSTAAAADSSFVTVEGYTVRCVRSAGAPTYVQTAASGSAQPAFVDQRVFSATRQNHVGLLGLIDDSVRVYTANDTPSLGYARDNLVRFLFGASGLPAGTINVTSGVTSTHMNCIPRTLLHNLARVDYWASSFSMVDYKGETQTSTGYCYRLVPATRSRNELVINNIGHALTWSDYTVPYPENQNTGGWRWLDSLLNDGYDVLCIQMEPTGYGGFDHQEMGWRFPTTERGHAIGIHLAHTIQCVNHASGLGFAKLYASGLSGGGWATVLACALDLRIDQGYSVFGGIPMYMRQNGVNQGDFEQCAADFYSRFGYLDLYSLAAQGRRFVHIWGDRDSIFGPSAFDNTKCGLRALSKAWADIRADWLDEINGAVASSGGEMVDLEDGYASTHQITWQAIGQMMHDMHAGTSYMYVVTASGLEKRLRSNGSLVSTVGTGLSTHRTSCIDWGKRLFLCDYAAAQVRVVNLDTAANTAVNVGNNPFDCCFDGSTHVWVTNSQVATSTVSTIDINTQTVDHTISLTASSTPYAIEWDRGNYVYVCESAAGKVARLDVTTFTVHDEITTSANPYGICYASGAYNSGGTANRWIYVTCYSSGKIEKIDVATGTVSATITPPAACIAIGWNGGTWDGQPGFGRMGYVYAVGFDSKKVYKYAIADNSLAATIDLPASATQPRTARWDGNDTIWIANSGASGGFLLSLVDDSVTEITTGNTPHNFVWDGVFW